MKSKDKEEKVLNKVLISHPPKEIEEKNGEKRVEEERKKRSKVQIKKKKEKRGGY